MVKGIPTLPSSYIEGQYMGEVLNTLTFNVKHINDFSQLRIPVELTSSDIENGGLVMQKKGSLPLAIRSTLAIPAAFSPVYIDGKLLVDGGLDRNYPANEVREMGANFVLGGGIQVSDSLRKKRLRILSTKKRLLIMVTSTFLLL